VNETALDSTPILHRLAAIDSKEEGAILNDLYERLDRYAFGVDGVRFRIDHKYSRNEQETGLGLVRRYNHARRLRVKTVITPCMACGTRIQDISFDLSDLNQDKV